MFFHRCGKLGWRPYGTGQRWGDGQSNTLPCSLTVLQNLRYYLSFAFIPDAPSRARAEGCDKGALRINSDETDVSAKQPPPEKDARVPGSDEHEKRAARVEAAPRQGAEAPGPIGLRERSNSWPAGAARRRFGPTSGSAAARSFSGSTSEGTAPQDVT